MAESTNKIDTAIDAIETDLGALVTAGTVKAVEQALHNPLTERRVPVIGLYPLRAGRAGGSAAPLWEVSLAVRILARAKGIQASETITELVATVQARLDALSDSASIAASIELGTWQFVYHSAVTNSPVGAMAILTLRFEGSL